MEEIIQTHNLTKYYGNLLAVDHVNFSVKKGEIFGFLGPNGAGKTTTIKMLVGLTSPSEGTAIINGYDIRTEILEIKRCIGVVPESSNLYDELTVLENLLFLSGLYHVPKTERKERSQRLLKTFDLWDRRENKFGKLSKGLKRRLTIAAALIHHPKTIFLDEPTTGLDVMSARILREHLEKLRETGTTTFLTTHYIEEADQLCDRIAVIVKGKVTTIDTPQNMKTAIQETPIIECIFNTPITQSMIKDLDHLGEVRTKDNRVRVLTKEVSKTLNTLTNIATEHRSEIIEINTLRPSLEDAFVNLTGIESETMRREKEQRGR